MAFANVQIIRPRMNDVLLPANLFVCTALRARQIFVTRAADFPDPVGTSHLCQNRTSPPIETVGGCHDARRDRTPYQLLASTSACSSQKGIFISRYIVVAMSRCSCACLRAPVRRYSLARPWWQ